jgi:4-hydroxy-3-methylbut-2-enyl diphosphate reductase
MEPSVKVAPGVGRLVRGADIRSFSNVRICLLAIGRAIVLSKRSGFFVLEGAVAPKWSSKMSGKPPLRILLCAPRGFCAGVVRAIDIVEQALDKYGAPVYVRHEIVHNKYVVDSLRAKGAVFISSLDEVTKLDAPVIFSAHGVPKSVPQAAALRQLIAIDATCPLVTKVHRECLVHFKRGLKIILIGHAGHPEVVGTIGQLPADAVLLVESVEDVERLMVTEAQGLAYATQTTLSVDDTRDIIAALKQRFPSIVGPSREDICYATTNRQEVVKIVAPRAEAMLVVGSPNSSNSQRLKDVAERCGCPYVRLVLRAVDVEQFWGLGTIAITAGASAPEVLVDEIMDAFRDRFNVEIETIVTATETMFFPLPRELRETV